MPDTTDRYPSDPGDPGKRLEERLRAIEQELRAIQGTNPLNSAVFQGTMRNVDAMGDTIGSWGPDGMSLVEGAFTVGGGPVRAIDFFYDEEQSSNVALTSAFAEFSVVTITPPDWATTVVVQAFCLFQMTNVSGAPQDLVYRATVNDIPGSGGWTNTIADLATGNFADYYQRTLTRGVDFTTTVEASGQVKVMAGTNNANFVRTKATVNYLR